MVVWWLPYQIIFYSEKNMSQTHEYNRWYKKPCVNGGYYTIAIHKIKVQLLETARLKSV